MRYALCLAGLLACGPTLPSDPRVDLAPVPSTPATLDIEVGGGATDFIPLTDGDPVDIIHGSQGGYHIWTSVRIHDTSVEEGTVNLSARFESDGARVGSPSGWAASPVLVDGARVQSGMRDFVDAPSAAAGKRIVLRAEVVTSDGRHGAGERVVVPRSP